MELQLAAAVVGVVAAAAVADDGAAVAVAAVIELVDSSVPCSAAPILSSHSQDWHLPCQRRPLEPYKVARRLVRIPVAWSVRSYAAPVSILLGVFFPLPACDDLPLPWLEASFALIRRHPAIDLVARGAGLGVG